MKRGEHRLGLAGALLTPPCPGPEALARIKQLPAAEQAELRECVDWVEDFEQAEAIYRQVKRERG